MLKITGAVLSAALIASFAAAPAQAALSLRIGEAGGNTVQFDDNAPFAIDTANLLPFTFADTNATTGIIQASINTTNSNEFTNLENANVTGAGSPVTAQGALTLNDFQVQVGQAGTVIVALTNTNQTAPTGAAYLNQQFSLTSLTGSATVTLEGYEYNGNSAFNTTGLNTGSGLSLSSVGGTSSSSAVGSFSAPYTITEVATIVFHTAGSLSVNFTGALSASPVPEPTSVVLFGTVLAGIAFAMRKRFQVNN